MLPLDSTLWIVHRSPGARAALARIARAASGVHEIVVGQPEDAIFDAISAPARLVVLGLGASANGADFEAELEFVRWALAKRFPVLEHPHARGWEQHLIGQIWNSASA